MLRRRIVAMGAFRAPKARQSAKSLFAARVLAPLKIAGFTQGGVPLEILFIEHVVGQPSWRQKMSRVRVRMIVIVLLLFCQTGFSQSTNSFPSGLGIELGFGYNNMFWRAPWSTRSSAGSAGDRVFFRLTPTFRLNYRAHLTGDFALLPIIGYAELGGSYGSGERYSFETLELGTFILYELTPFSFGAGMKINRHFRIRYFQEDSEERGYSDWFIKWSEDIGFKATYMFLPWSVSVESWFGLNNLADPETLTHTTVRQNNYRLLIGYSL